VSWRLIVAINLPIAAIVVAVTWRHVPETRDPDATAPIDIAGGCPPPPGSSRQRPARHGTGESQRCRAAR
jgi:hypothetical protein